MKLIHPVNTIICAFAALMLVSCHNRNSVNVVTERNLADTAKRSEHTDNAFALKAADNAMLEVQLAQLVVQTTETPEVKKLAQTILMDQLKVNTELEGVASGLNIVMTGVMSDSTREKYNALSEIADTDYAQQYIHLVENNYQDGIMTYKKQLEYGNDPELKEWAASKIKILQDHLNQAQKVKRSLQKDS